MKIIHPYELKKNLIKKLDQLYIFLGEDFYLLHKNQNLILKFGYKKGFLEKNTIDIKNNQDWEKIFLFYERKSLFFKKTILVINLLIKKLNSTIIQNIKKMLSLLNLDVLIILKFYRLSLSIEKNTELYKLQEYSSIVSCFTPYDSHFIHWIQEEIQEKKINIEKTGFLLLCKYYEGNTFFIANVLDLLKITWPNIYITKEKIKEILLDSFNFSPIHWINAMFQGYIKKAIYILNFFRKQRYEPLLLIRYLQKDLLRIINIQRRKNTNIYTIFTQDKILKTRHKFFINASKKINFNILFKAIQTLVKIEIKIKKTYNNCVWNELKELTLILC